MHSILFTHRVLVMVSTIYHAAVRYPPLLNFEETSLRRLLSHRGVPFNTVCNYFHPKGGGLRTVGIPWY